MSDSENKPSRCTLNSVEFHSPPFWENDPVLWFINLEANFFNRRVTSDCAKYNQLINRLPQNISSQVRDILSCPPPEMKYETLKQAIIQRTTPSDKARLQQLFRDLQLGDRMPSALLRDMQQLLGTSNMDAGILRELWMQRLPENTQAILAVANALPLTAVADLADRVIERHQPTTSAHALTLLNAVASSAAPTTSEPSAIDALSAQVATLQRQVEQLSLGRRHRRRSSPSPRRPKANAQGYCFYHARFGAKARKCEQPCSFSASKQGNFQAGP